jgi:hypothetical protein
MRRLLPLVGAAAFAALLTAVVTWPQAIHPTLVADHFDPYFSIWRLGHIAHALTRWPMHLFDGNIFYPDPNTLAYSDATLLEGVLGAPLMWARLSPSLVYNLLLAAGFVGSGIGMFILCRHVTGETWPSLISTAVFTLLPYRIEHVMHLELQWAMFVPLSLWAVHRTMESGRWRHGLLLGLFLWLQFLCCLYYGVFLSLTLIVFVPVLLTFKGHVPFRTFAPPLASGAVIAGLLTLPYTLPYFAASRAVGARPLEEISRYSALPISYLVSPEYNRLWGWTSTLWGAPELRLFPGLIAIVLGIAAFWHPRRRMVLLYAVTTFIVVQLSFGMNGTLYRSLLGHVSSLQGFRALARFGIIAGCGLSVLAGLGAQAIASRLSLAPARRRAFVAIVIGLMIVEYSNRPLPLSQAVEAEAPDVYRVLSRAAPGPIVEFPVPDPRALPGYDPYYQAWSVWHWRPMLNGYSGFYAPEYLAALPVLARFPDDDSIALLRERHVKYVIVHRSFYKREEYTELALKLARQPKLVLWGVYKDPYGLADVLEVRP